MNLEEIGKKYESILENEVRKEGGIYYTPPYIVDYIVHNTIGELVKDKTPADVAKIKIVDPACGAGVFLLGAYQFLLDWHRNYYAEHSLPSKGMRTDPLLPDGQLTIEEKKRILANNIFGVDIDMIAVEFAKLSLLLKCMEGESSATLQRLKIFHERMLPNIDGNIRVGNSLVDTDYYDMYSDNGSEATIKPLGLA